MLNRIKLQFALAVFWFVSAYLAIGAVLPWTWAWRCAWLNLIIGLVALLLVTGNERGDKLFYIGPKGNEEGGIEIAVLWIIPTAGLFVALLWWILRIVGIFDW